MLKMTERPRLWQRGRLMKELCKMKKALKKDLSTYMAYVIEPTHVCKKCGRAANQKKRLCKSKKIKV
jgi:hypothetical protein